MKNYTKNLLILLKVVMVAGFVTACNKNSGSNNAQTVNNGWGTGCVGCGVNGGQAIASGLQFQTSNGVLTGTADIYGDGSQMNYNSGNCIPQASYNGVYNTSCQTGYGYNNGYNYGQNILYTYVGQASINGQMNINQNVQAGGGYYGYNQGYQNNCVIPAGTYTIQTQQVGYYQQGVLQNFRLIASGPAQLEITMMSGTLTANGQLRLGMNAVIERINGQSCGQVPFSTY